MSWQGHVIGTLFLRTDRNAQPFTQDDIEYSRVVADVTARALRLAHEVEQVQRLQGVEHGADAERPRAVVSFIHRLTGGFLEQERRSNPQLPDRRFQELDRLVATALSAMGQEQRLTQPEDRPGSGRTPSSG
jgi:GAF domain-containing protein